MGKHIGCAVVGRRAQGVALNQRAEEHGAVQIACAGEAAVDVQLFDHEAVLAGTGAADVLAHGKSGDHGAGGQRDQRVGQRLCGGFVQLGGSRVFLEQQGGLGGIGQDEVGLCGQLPHPVHESRGHGGVGPAVIAHDGVHHLAGIGPERKGFLRQRDLFLAAEVAGVDALKFQPQRMIVLQRGGTVGTAVHPGRGAKAACVGGQHHRGQRHGLNAHDRQHRQDHCEAAPPHTGQVVDTKNFFWFSRFQQESGLLRAIERAHSKPSLSAYNTVYHILRDKKSV